MGSFESQQIHGHSGNQETPDQSYDGAIATPTPGSYVPDVVPNPVIPTPGSYVPDVNPNPMPPTPGSYVPDVNPMPLPVPLPVPNPVPGYNGSPPPRKH